MSPDLETQPWFVGRGSCSCKATKLNHALTLEPSYLAAYSTRKNGGVNRNFVLVKRVRDSCLETKAIGDRQRARGIGERREL